MISNLRNFFIPKSQKRLENYPFKHLAYRSSRPDMFCKKGVLKKFAKFIGKHRSQTLFFNKVTGLSNFIEIETLAQVFFYDFCEFLRTSFFNRTPPVAASVLSFFVWLELRFLYAPFYFTLSFTLPMFLIIKLLVETQQEED